jgi:hypothetical protein
MSCHTPWPPEVSRGVRTWMMMHLRSCRAQHDELELENPFLFFCSSSPLACCCFVQVLVCCSPTWALGLASTHIARIVIWLRSYMSFSVSPFDNRIIKIKEFLQSWPACLQIAICSCSISFLSLLGGVALLLS